MEEMHISDDDLERYSLNVVTGAELEWLTEHLLWCTSCIERAEQTKNYVDEMRAVLSQLNEESPLKPGIANRPTIVEQTPARTRS
jgi:hypothetical protein